MIRIYNNRIFIPTFTEHVKWLIENSTHELYIVYLNSKNLEKEEVNKHNYIRLCKEIDRCREKQIGGDQIFMVEDIGELTMTHTRNSYQEVGINYSSSIEDFRHLRFGSKDY